MLKKLNHGVYQIEFHFYFVTKCRYKIFRSDYVKNVLRDILQTTAKKHNIELSALGIADEHVHGIAKLHPNCSPARFEQLMKGCSSWALFQILPNLRKRYRRGSIWGRNKGLRSVGDVTLDIATDYVLHHNKSQMLIGDF